MEQQIAFRKKYTIRRAGGESKDSIQLTCPFEVIEREARLHNLSVDDFMEQFEAVAQYGTSPGVLYTFEPKDEHKQP